MTLTADAEGGSVAVSILDEGGASLLESEPLAANKTDQPVLWKNGGSLEKYVGGKIRLRATIRNAKVYAFGFSAAP